MFAAVAEMGPGGDCLKSSVERRLRTIEVGVPASQFGPKRSFAIAQIDRETLIFATKTLNAFGKAEHVAHITNSATWGRKSTA